MWWDATLTPGERFAEVIDREIQAASCVIVVWTESSVSSQWVKNEALEGMDREVLVPVLFDPVRLPVAFKQHQIADFTQWPHEVDTNQYQRVISAVRGMVHGQANDPAKLPGVANAVAKRGLRKRRRYVLPIAILAILGIASILAFIDWQPATHSKMPRLTINRFISNGGEDSEFYASSITRELQLRLERTKGIELVRVGSIWDLKLTDVPEALTRKNADYIVSGKVQAKADKIDVTVNLADAPTGKTIWKKQFEDDVSNVSELQQNIVKGLLSEMKMVSSTPISAGMIRPTTTDKVAYRDYLIGQDLLRRGETHNVRQAISRFEEAVARDPSFMQAVASTCHAYLELFRATKSIDDFNKGKQNCKKVLAVDKSSVESHLALAELFRASGELQSAKLEFLNTLDLDADNPDAMIGLADVLVKQGDMQGGEHLYERCVKENPTYWKAQNALGNFYFRQGMFYKAAESYTRVTELTSSNAVAFSNLGAARLYAGNFQGATAAWRRANELETNSASFSNLGTALYYEGKYSEALKQYKAALSMDPGDHRLWGNLADNLRLIPGRAEEARKDYDKAISLANAVIKVNPDDAYTLSRLAVYYAAIGNRVLSIEMAQRAEKLAGLDLNVLYDLAVASSLLGNSHKAQEYVDKALNAGYPIVLVRSDPQLKGLEEPSNDKNG